MIGERKIVISKIIKHEMENYLNLLKSFENYEDLYLFFSFANQKYNLNAPLTEKSIQDFFKKYTKCLNKKLFLIDLRNSYFIYLNKFQADIEINQINKFSSINFNGEYLELKKPARYAGLQLKV